MTSAGVAACVHACGLGRPAWPTWRDGGSSGAEVGEEEGVDGTRRDGKDGAGTEADRFASPTQDRRVREKRRRCDGARVTRWVVDPLLLYSTLQSVSERGSGLLGSVGVPPRCWWTWVI